MSEKTIRKNLDLPLWVVDVLKRKAKSTGHKFKPWVEWRLERIAHTEKLKEENSNPVYKPKKQ
jgi:hypothetical protein